VKENKTKYSNKKNIFSDDNSVNYFAMEYQTYHLDEIVQEMEPNKGKPEAGCVELWPKLIHLKSQSLVKYITKGISRRRTSMEKICVRKIFRIFLLVLVLIVLCITPVLAAESWATDPKTGCQIGWESDNFTLVAASWSGPVVDGKADGKGRLTLTLHDKDGKEVTGKATAELKQGKLDGNVDLKWSDGESYRGAFRNGKMDGKGVLKYNNGNSYEGSFLNGKRDGKAVYKWKNGDVYEGDFKDDLRNGKGVMKWKNGDAYEGEFKDDLPNGKGIYKWKNNNVYEGDFKDGKKDGKGVLKFKEKHYNGDVYEGDFKDDLATGKGVYKWLNGYSEEGDMVNGQLNGYGVYKSSTGEIIYQGLWKNGAIISMNAKEKFVSI
jgi:hypothetical protein